MTVPTPTTTTKNQPVTPARSGAPVAPIAHSVQTLVTLLERQQSLYQQLHSLSDQQGQMVATGSTEALLSLLAQRQQFIDELGKINTELQPYRSQWPQLKKKLAEPDRRRISALVEQAEQMLSGIIEQDNRDRQQLEQSKTHLGGEMGRVSQGGAMMRAYKTSSGRDANRLTDQQG